MALYPPDEDIDTDRDRGRLRVLLMASAGPLFVGYTGVVALLSLVISVAEQAEITASSVFWAALPGWLGAYQVPLDLDGHDLSALPLLPTLLVVLLVGRAAGRAADRLMIVSARGTLPVVLSIMITHAVAGGLIAQATSAAAVVPGLLVPAAVSGVAAIIGLARRGCFEAVFKRLDELVAHGLRAGLLGLATILGIGALLFLVGLSMSFTTVRALFSPSAGDSVGMLLLSIAYLPNAVLGGTAFAAGPGVTIGGLAVSPLHYTAGPLPGVPVLAALPETGAPWWPVVFVLPLGVGALVGWVLRKSSEDSLARLRSVGVAAVVVASGCVILGFGSGGQLADGVFDPLSMHPWSLGMAVLLWIALPAAVVAWWTGVRVGAPSCGILDDSDSEEADKPEKPDEPEEPEEAEPEEAEEPATGQSEEEPGEPEGIADLPGEIDK
ncbi:MAG: DUF6350 family protein [Kibdelosporangium sp.]